MQSAIPPRLSREQRRAKLAQLKRNVGLGSDDEMMERATCDGIVPGICTIHRCEYTCETEPDQDRGWCPECHDNTVWSCVVLAGFL